MLLRIDFHVGNLVNHNTPPTLLFFVSVDSGGFRFVVSCLESTLVGWLVSVAFKWVRGSMDLMRILAGSEMGKRV